MFNKRPKHFLLISAFAFIVLSCSSNDEMHKNTTHLLDDIDWQFETMSISRIDSVAEETIHDRYYLSEVDSRQIWEWYTTSDPSELWTGPMVNLEGVYNPADDEFYSKSVANLPELAENQVLFLDLVVESMLHIPTSIIITEINDDKRRLVFNYTEINPASGRQEISFHEIEDESGYRTLIRHRSWFSNESGLRNRLYPVYHEQAADELHRHIARYYGAKLKLISASKLEKRGLIPEDQPL